MTAGSIVIPERCVRLDGGRFMVGNDEQVLAMDGEGPSRQVRLAPFAIDPHAVTNAWFAEFVAATGYRTDAERIGWSAVFAGLLPAATARTATASRTASWWQRIEGASWRQPEGPGSSIGERMNHPVVHVSWNDATAFAGWAGGRIPSEAEWEFAAASGIAGRRFPWGEREPNDTDFTPCNIWQGEFPTRNTVLDGHFGTAPVDSFAPNAFGLRHMVGNTWEWCADAFRVRSLTKPARQRNAAAERAGDRLMKGGSYLCHRSYCYRYRIAARSGVAPDTSTGHVGFRIVFDLPSRR
jgi:formylglycine-generating enzyme required for sulfatase activity